MNESTPSVLIAGCGINGLLTALLFQREGLQVTLCDSGSIPEPSAASHGMHRQIHPFGQNGREASQALSMWHKTLRNIGCDGFLKTGMLHAGLDVTPAVAISPEIAEDLVPGSSRAGLVTHATEYGVLLADKILRALASALFRNGAVLRTDCTVEEVDAQTGVVRFTKHPPKRHDHVVMASGHRTAGIAGLERIASHFAPIRTYVLYMPPDALPDSLIPRTSWVDLFGTDLWGMPPLGKMPAKFGFGGAAHLDTVEPPSTRQIRDQFIDAYGRLDVRYDCLSVGRVASNVYAKVPGVVRAVTDGRCSVITSDNGSGFKFAPLAAYEAFRQGLEALRRNV